MYQSNSTYEAVLLKAAFILAFHALLRVCEFALSKGNTSDRILHIGDVSLSNEQIVLSIRHSKTDQLGFGTSVVVKASSGPTCPVAAMKNLLQVRPNIAGPLFCHFSGTTITRYQFSAIFKRSLKICNIDDTNFKSHSFCIGAATSLARQGTINTYFKWQVVGSQMLSILTFVKTNCLRSACICMRLYMPSFSRSAQHLDRWIIYF